MNDRPSCDEIALDFIIERYVAGTLSASETAEFEEHLLTCNRCQKEIPLAVALRESLAPATNARARRPRRLVPSVVTLAAAAALAAVLLVSRERVPQALSDLGRVSQPPVYLGVAVRQVPSGSDSLFDEAMAAYGASDFAIATTRLSSALAAGADSVPVQFFAGASLLMTGRPADAAEAFRSVIHAGDTPYTAEARYYLAKALLRLGRVDEALAELQSVANGTAEIAPEARALADSVEAVVGS